MRRREFAKLVAATVAWPMVASAQQRMPVIGFLSSGSPGAGTAANVAGFQQGLSENGFVVGKNIEIEYHLAETRYDRLPGLAADLVSRKVDVILAAGGTPPTLAAKAATSTIPIVFANLGDPVGQGVVASLARPGGNLTGNQHFLSGVDRQADRAARPRRRGGRMRRRDFWRCFPERRPCRPLLASAQQRKLPTIGYLSMNSPDIRSERLLCSRTG